MCISISPLSTASDLWKKGLSPLSRLIKERICSKQLYLNLSCLLFLQPPPTATAWQINSPVHADHRSLCTGDMCTMEHKEAGHRSNADKGTLMRSRPHTHWHAWLDMFYKCMQAFIDSLIIHTHIRARNWAYNSAAHAHESKCANKWMW